MLRELRDHTAQVPAKARQHLFSEIFRNVSNSAVSAYAALRGSYCPREDTGRPLALVSAHVRDSRNTLLLQSDRAVPSRAKITRRWCQVLWRHPSEDKMALFYSETPFVYRPLPRHLLCQQDRTKIAPLVATATTATGSDLFLRLAKKAYG